MTVREIFPARDIVGESIVWDAARRALAWVDIGGRRIHRYELATGRHELWSTPEFPTSIGLRSDGGAIVGLTTRVALWDWGGEFRTLAVPEPDLADNRLNEGRVAPDGSFWVATMQDNLNDDGSPREMNRNSGAVYRIDANGECTALTPREYGVGNTMAWTDDGRFLFADTIKDTIYQFDLGGDGRTLSDRRAFAGPLGRGLPDGSCLDRAGYLWNCRVAGGAAVARFSASGELDRLIDLPCSWPTSCAFGGEGVATLFVTSARFTMTPDHLAANPREGSVFAISGLAEGRLEPLFRAR